MVLLLHWYVYSILQSTWISYFASEKKLFYLKFVSRSEGLWHRWQLQTNPQCVRMCWRLKGCPCQGLKYLVVISSPFLIALEARTSILKVFGSIMHLKFATHTVKLFSKLSHILPFVIQDYFLANPFAKIDTDRIRVKFAWNNPVW